MRDLPDQADKSLPRKFVLLFLAPCRALHDAVHDHGKEKEKGKDGETASERGWDGYEYPFELWYSEMKSWLGAENG